MGQTLVQEGINQLTVAVEPIENFNALRMVWQREVESQHVRAAFETINNSLDKADEPMYIVVDLLRNPDFPLRVTIQGALAGPYRHEMLKEWLIVGSNPLARMIERVLSTVTGRKNVYWFNSEADALAHITAAQLK